MYDEVILSFPAIMKVFGFDGTCFAKIFSDLSKLESAVATILAELKLRIVILLSFDAMWNP